MTQLTVGGTDYTCQSNESVLEALSRQGVVLPSACLVGACHCCMLKASSGAPPAESQVGLRESHKAQDYFLACQCYPNQDMTIIVEEIEGMFTTTTIVERFELSESVLGLRLRLPEGFDYYSGQFVNLKIPDGTMRSYSLASSSSKDSFLELHISQVVDGRVSSWLRESAEVGSEVKISEAIGDCFLAPGDSEQTLLLIGTGTGLAPLYGILREALSHNLDNGEGEGESASGRHTGPIFLYHGGAQVDKIYLQDELSALEDEYPNFHYIRCLDSGDKQRGLREGRASEIALADHPKLAGYRVFICGNPDMVKATQRNAYLQGADLNEIYSDAFLPSRQVSVTAK